MLSITGFHGLTMTPNWARLTDWLSRSLSLGNLLAFSLGMTLLLLLPILVYAVLVWFSYSLGNNAAANGRLSFHDYFVRYAYALLPIALFYHLAHNMEHLLMEGPKVVALISDPFGWNWNLLGTAHWSTPPLVSLDVLWIVQVAAHARIPPPAVGLPTSPAIGRQSRLRAEGHGLRSEAEASEDSGGSNGLPSW